MKILLLGAGGMLGVALAESLPAIGAVTALARRSSQAVGDICDFSGIAHTIQRLEPDVIVNAAAFTQVDLAESQCEIAFRVNADAVANLARLARNHAACLIHFSTDYVFDGHGADAFSEEAPSMPLNVYGKSKRAGEIAIIDSGCEYLIFRTSWLYALHGKNFLAAIVRQAMRQQPLTVVCDQIGAPTPAALVADITARAIARRKAKPLPRGVYHITATGETSWYGFAEQILKCARDAGIPWLPEAGTIVPAKGADYPSLARRPLNSRLATAKVQQCMNISVPHWQKGLSELVLRKFEMALANDLD